MKINEEIKRLLDTLEVEATLLDRYRRGQEELRVYLKERQWEEMTRLLERLDLLSQEISQVEERRYSLFESLAAHYGLPRAVDFYQLVVRMPQDVQEPLAEAYRRIKITVTQIEGISLAIDVYIRSVGEVMNQVLGEFYPHRKGNIYSRHGRSVPVNSNPMIFNKSL